jgi:hypothetical protein
MPVLLTRDFLRNHVREQLGRGVVRVELTDAQIDAAIGDAARLYNRYVPRHKRAVLPASPNGRYALSDLHPMIQEVVNVVGVRNRDTSVGDRIDLFDPLIYMPGGAINTGGLATYLQSLESIEYARRIFSSEVEWTTQWENDGGSLKLIMYIATATSSNQVYGYEYVEGVTADDSPTSGLRFVGQDMHDWFVRYVLAVCTRTLGRALRKFQGIPGPEGADLQLDGTDLVTDAENALSDLTDQIQQTRTSFPYIIQ